MNKKTLGLCLSLSVLFATSCQKEDTAEQIQQETLQITKTGETKVNSKIHEPVFADGIEAQIHEPIYFENELGASIHEPIYIFSFEDCESFDHFEGTGNLTVPSKKEESYHGEIDLKNLNVGGTLNVCGVLMAEKANLHRGGVVNIGGGMLVGTEESKNLVITSGAHLNIEGDLIVKGDLILNNGATLEFVGADNSVRVDGEVIAEEGSFIVGEFEDVSDKF